MNENKLHIDGELSEIKTKHQLSKTVYLEIKQLINNTKIMDNDNTCLEINEKKLKEKVSIYFDLPYKLYSKIKKYFYLYYSDNYDKNISRSINPFDDRIDGKSENIDNIINKYPAQKNELKDIFSKYNIMIKPEKIKFISVFSYDNKKYIGDLLKFLKKNKHINIIKTKQLRNEDTHGFTLFTFNYTLILSDKYIKIEILKDGIIIIEDLEKFVDSVQYETDNTMLNLYNILPNIIKNNYSNKYIQIVSFNHLGEYKHHIIKVKITGKKDEYNYKYILPLIDESYPYLQHVNIFYKYFNSSLRKQINNINLLHIGDNICNTIFFSIHEPIHNIDTDYNRNLISENIRLCFYTRLIF